MPTITGDNNSLEVYTSLMINMCLDIAQCYPEGKEVLSDLSKIRQRVKHEGFSFYTKTLPLYGKAIDLALHTDTALCVPGLQKQPGTSTPKLFGWLVAHVFLPTGYARKDASVPALRHLRQVLYFMYKLNLPYAEHLKDKVLSNFKETERDLERFDCLPDSLSPILRDARTCMSRVLGSINPWDIIPRHGPGAVSTGEEVGQKANFSRIYRDLDKMYPFTEYFMLGLNQVVDCIDRLNHLESLEYGTAKVVLVPKDSRGPRLISCEPLEIQWIQQGLRSRLYDTIERHRLTCGHVNFTDQNINRNLALSASLTQEWVTLDMKDASDRVSLSLVRELFSGTRILAALIAARSEKTKLPSGELVTLRKYAPMGSALCFPVEAMVFWSLAVGVLHTHGRSWKHCFQSIYVYGDDIICKREDYALLLQYFPEFGLMFNSSKCCTSGFFRESCGCDAFRGIDVTPVRLRTRWSHRKTQSASELTSYVELFNSLYGAGYCTAAGYIQQLVEGRYGPIPVIPSNMGMSVAWRADDVNHQTYNKRCISRYNDILQRLEYRVWVVRPCTKRYRVNGWNECLRVLTCGSTGSDTGTFALPRRSRLIRGWAPAPIGCERLIPIRDDSLKSLKFRYEMIRYAKSVKSSS